MTKVVLPNTNQTGANEWADVEGNDVAIREVVNGQLDNENIASGAAIAASKLTGILKSTGGSTFSVNYGEVECTFPGVSLETEAVEVTHGLGAEPKAVWFTPKGNSGEAKWAVAEWVSSTSTKFTVKALSSLSIPGNGVKAKFVWVAFT